MSVWCRQRVLAQCLRLRKFRAVASCGLAGKREFSNGKTPETSLPYTPDRSYLTERYPPDLFTKNRPSLVPWAMFSYHYFFQRFSSKWDASTATYLDYSGGPTIFAMISAVPHVAKIYHSDFTELNCKEVLMWKNKDPEAFDWGPYFKHVVHTLERNPDPEAVIKREEDLRSQLQAVFHCDVMGENLLSADIHSFDIINAASVLDSVCTSAEHLLEVLKKMFLLIKPNGYFLWIVDPEGTWWKAGETKSHFNFYLRKDEVAPLLETAGFEVCHAEFKSWPDECKALRNTPGRMFFIAQRPA